MALMFSIHRIKTNKQKKNAFIYKQLKSLTDSCFTSQPEFVLKVHAIISSFTKVDLKLWEDKQVDQAYANWAYIPSKRKGKDCWLEKWGTTVYCMHKHNMEVWPKEKKGINGLDLVTPRAYSNINIQSKKKRTRTK